jgi:hypothetical protein
MHFFELIFLATKFFITLFEHIDKRIDKCIYPHFSTGDLAVNAICLYDEYPTILSIT